MKNVSLGVPSIQQPHSSPMDFEDSTSTSTSSTRIRTLRARSRHTTSSHYPRHLKSETQDQFDLKNRRVQVMSTNLQALKGGMDRVADTTRQMVAGGEMIGKTVGAVTTPILGSLSRGMTQSVVDAQQYENWASESIERWGWNDTTFGYACGLAVRGMSVVAGSAVGLVYGIWAGGKQAYDHYDNDGVLKGGWQAISNAFYACEPTRFSNPITLVDQHTEDY
jgi:hypothetical protein